MAAEGFRSWPRAVRLTTYVAALAVLVATALAAAALVTVRRSFPQTSGTIEVAGLADRVRVVRDQYGVPQIYASSSEDLFYAQGYVEAQDRFWQMDAWRHITAGRLSELVGKDALETDEFTRTMGWRRVAEQELDLLDKDTVGNLQAFSRGVTAYIRTHGPSQLSLEYTLLAAQGLDYDPEPWTPVDSLAWLKAIAWDLHGNSDDELARALLAPSLTDARIAELYPPYPYADHAPITTLAPTPAAPATALSAALSATKAVFDSFPSLLGRGAGVGSNAWAVSGALTTTGAPILANDPHLLSSLPGIWYQIGLHCTEVGDACPYDVAGFTFPGMPGVVIGHNDQIAWGFTNLQADVADLYLEQVTGATYLYDGEQLPLAAREETIKVLGGKPVRITVRETRHGPLMSDVAEDWSKAGAGARVPAGSPGRGDGYAVALRWTGLLPDTTMDALFELDRARDWEEFRAAARDFAAPSQNMVYADRAGHIGYQAPGLIPTRPAGDSGDAPVPGWTSAHEWTGWVPFDALPSVLDPASGYVVTANQAVTPPGAAYYLGDQWDYGYRSQRIADLLDAKTKDGGKVSVADMNEIQNDTWNGLGPVLVPYLLQLRMTGFDAIGQRLLQGWDFTQPKDSAAAAYFNAVYRNLLRLTFDDELPEGLRPDGDSRWFAVLGELLTQPDSAWWDDKDTVGVVETRDDILREAMREGRDEVIREQDRDPALWRWGFVHTLELRNETLGSGGSAIANRLLNRGGFEVAGGTSVVDATAWDPAEGFSVTWAPSMRMVVSLADFDDSTWVNLTGASGHAFSEHYTDQTRVYAAGRTLPWRFRPEQGRVLELVPS